MKILVTGATGLIGKEVVETLARVGYEIFAITRNRKTAERELPCPATIIEWDYKKPEPLIAAKDIDAVIHLAGENLAVRRWNEETFREIRQSRVLFTKNLFLSLREAGANPSVIIGASATGIYGSNGDEIITENSAPASDPVARLCQDWETSLFANDFASARTVAFRFGVVLTRQGGALEKMCKPFRIGAGGKLGSGNQYFSWIHIDDLKNLVQTALTYSHYSGCINATAPSPLRNSELTKILAEHFKKPALLTVPEFALKIAVGDMAQLLLDSQNIRPQKAIDNGFAFQYLNFQSAIKNLLPQKPNAHYLIRKQWFAAPPEKIFALITDVSKLKELVPPWILFQIQKCSTEQIGAGTQLDYMVRLHGFPLHWTTQILDYRAPEFFADTQSHGPFAHWYHTHQFVPLQGGTLMIDIVEYEVPAAIFGQVLARPFVQKDLANIFDFRGDMAAKLL